MSNKNIHSTKNSHSDGKLKPSLVQSKITASSNTANKTSAPSLVGKIDENEIINDHPTNHLPKPLVSTETDLLWGMIAHHGKGKQKDALMDQFSGAGGQTFLNRLEEE